MNRAALRRWADESAVTDLLIAGALGGSAVHVYSVCMTNNDSDRITAGLTTLAVELLAFAALRDLRRHGPRPVPVIALLVGIGLTVAANLATADDNGRGWGWPETVAVSPAVLAALALLMRETRPERDAKRVTRSATRPARVAERREQVSPPPPSPPRTVPPADPAGTPAVSQPVTSRQIVAAARTAGIEPSWDPDNASHRRAAQRRVAAARAGSEPDTRWLSHLGLAPDGTPLPRDTAAATADG